MGQIFSIPSWTYKLLDIIPSEMNYNEYTMESTVWLYPGMAGWHFITIPKDVSDDITQQFGNFKRGWGSLPVRATIQNTTWETSIFPDKKLQAYVLPIKSEIRKKEHISANDTVYLTLEIKK